MRPYDFLKSRIKIGKYVFILETQVARNTWDEKNPNEKLVPSIYVLNVLTKNIDEILRTIECYARLEEELISYTANLLMIYENDYPVEDFRKDFYFRNDSSYPLRFASQDSYVDWNDLKNCITDSYEYQLE